MSQGATFTQMTKYTLNALKGWPSPHAVDYHTEFDESIVVPVRPGSVVHLNPDGKYEMGVGTAPVMPLFMFNGSNDPDVQNYGGDPATERGVWIGITPTGQAMSLVGIGAYELVSTAFDATATYAPNDALTSPDAGALAGSLTVGTLYTDMIVGFVSRGVIDNGYNEDAVAFWPFPVFPN